VRARPISWQILRSAVDGTIPFDNPGAADADKRRKREARFLRAANGGIEHF
jgi:hypothetical protein